MLNVVLWLLFWLWWCCLALLLLLLLCWTGTQADRLKELARTNRATLISTKMKIETERKKQLELRQKTIAVMKLVER